jgi:hypothetical protein
MEGGIAIILLVLVVVVGGGIGIVGYLAGWWLRPAAEADGSRVRGSERRRPVHTVVTDEADQRFVGTPDRTPPSET